MPRPKKQHLKQRKDGRYCCVADGIQFMGRTEDEALALRKEYLDQKSGRACKPMTIAEYAQTWLPIARPEASYSTYRGLATHLEKLVDSIGGDTFLKDITPLAVKKVYSEKYHGLSNSYILNGKQLFCEFFDSACAEGYCKSNPARDKSAKPAKGKPVKKRELTAQQRYWIENLCTDHRCHPIVMAMLYAGLRPPEAKAIDIDRDIDFKNETITLHEFAHAVEGSKYAYTDTGKNGWSQRTIPLFPPLKTALMGKHGYLITSKSGERVNVMTWRQAWDSYKAKMEAAINGCPKNWYGRKNEHKKILAEGKSLPAWITFDVIPYDLRHAFCVMCRDNNVDIKTCIAWMGHSDIKMILSVYDSATNRSAAEAERLKTRLLNMQNDMQAEKPNAETLTNQGSQVSHTDG